MIDIMKDYLGADYPSGHKLLSGGDQLTCEYQVGAQRHRMDGNTMRDQSRKTGDSTLAVCVEKCIATWFIFRSTYVLVTVEEAVWTVCSLLKRNTVTADVKKAVDDTLDQRALPCRILVNDKLALLKADTSQQLMYIHQVANKVVQPMFMYLTQVTEFTTTPEFCVTMSSHITV